MDRRAWSTVTLSFEPLNHRQASAILEWCYEPPYDMYNMAADDQVTGIAALMDPGNCYYAMTDGKGELLGYCCFGSDARVPGGDYSSAALDVGMGLRPDLTGQGHGHRYLDAIHAFAVRQFEATTFRVTVAAFNVRALHLCQQAGFREVSRFCREDDGMAFVILVRDT